MTDGRWGLLHECGIVVCTLRYSDAADPNEGCVGARLRLDPQNGRTPGIVDWHDSRCSPGHDPPIANPAENESNLHRAPMRAFVRALACARVFVCTCVRVCVQVHAGACV